MANWANEWHPFWAVSCYTEPLPEDPTMWHYAQLVNPEVAGDARRPGWKIPDKCPHGLYQPKWYCALCGATGKILDPVEAGIIGPWLPTIRKQARIFAVGFARVQVDVFTLTGKRMAYTAGAIQKKKDLSQACCAHLLTKKKQLQQLIDSVGADSPQAKGYVRRCCANYLVTSWRKPQGQLEDDISHNTVPLTLPDGEENPKISSQVQTTQDGTPVNAAARGRRVTNEVIDGATSKGSQVIIPVETWRPTMARPDLIEKLPPEHRAVVIARHLEGRKWNEVSEVTGIPERTARRYFNTAVEKLERWAKQPLPCVVAAEMVAHALKYGGVPRTAALHPSFHDHAPGTGFKVRQPVQPRLVARMHEPLTREQREERDRRQKRAGLELAMSSVLQQMATATERRFQQLAEAWCHLLCEKDIVAGNPAMLNVSPVAADGRTADSSQRSRAGGNMTEKEEMQELWM